MDNSDAQLLRLLRADSQQGMCRLIDEYGGAVTTICSHTLKAFHGSLTDDAVQETFVRLWKSLSKADFTVDNLKAYVYQTARNCSLTILRDNKSSSDISLDDPESYGIEKLCCTLKGSSSLSNEDFQIIHSTVNDMAEPNRTIFVLRYFYSFTVREIATRLKLKPDNVESRLRRNKEKLRKELEKRGVSYE